MRDRLLGDIAPPSSTAEVMVLRGRLAMIAHRAARFRHDLFHRLLCVPRCGCDVQPTEGALWNDGRITPLDAFRVWSRRYEDAFEASHPWPLAIRAALLLEKESWFDLNLAARALGCSRSGLTHRFRQVMGLSLRDYHLRVRMRRALTLLRESDDAVDAVAAMSGYAATETFRRAFRKATHLTPTEARALSVEDADRLARTLLALGADVRYAKNLN